MLEVHLADNADVFQLQLTGMLCMYRDMRMHVCQDFAADVGANFCAFEVPCVVAWSGTKAMIWVYQRGLICEKVLANKDEHDRLQGCKAGFSCDGYTVDVTEDDRNGVTGRVFSNDAVHMGHHSYLARNK